MPERSIDYVPLADLKPNERNVKQHALEDLDASFSRFGYLDPVLIDERSGLLVSGHGRVDGLRERRERGEAAPEGVRVDAEGVWLVPVVRGWASADDAELQAATIAANRLVEKGGYDDSGLVALLEELSVSSRGLEGVGYSAAEFDELLVSVRGHERSLPGAGAVDEIPEAPAEPVTKRGDVWLCGAGHRILCGDCRDPDDVAKVLGGGLLHLAFTSPPYADRRDYDESSGFRPVPPEEYVAWFAPVAANVAAHLAEDGSWFVNIKEHCEDGQRVLYVKDLATAHVREWGWKLVDEFCWLRAAVPGSWSYRFKNGWEPVFHFARGTPKCHPDAVARDGDADELARLHTYDADAALPSTGSPFAGGAYRSYSGKVLPSNVLEVHQHNDVAHSAVFPVGLPAWFIRAYTDPGDGVLDPFLGSGSTLLAAHQEGRIGYGIELSPRYVDVCLARFERTAGEKPLLEATGEPHSFLADA